MCFCMGRFREGVCLGGDAVFRRLRPRAAGDGRSRRACGRASGAPRRAPPRRRPPRSWPASPRPRGSSGRSRATSRTSARGPTGCRGRRSRRRRAGSWRARARPASIPSARNFASTRSNALSSVSSADAGRRRQVDDEPALVERRAVIIGPGRDGELLLDDQRAIEQARLPAAEQMAEHVERLRFARLRGAAGRGEIVALPVRLLDLRRPAPSRARLATVGGSSARMRSGRAPRGLTLP